MLLGAGILTAVFGYTSIYWGVNLAKGTPVTWAYSLGLSKTNNVHASAADGLPAVDTETPAQKAQTQHNNTNNPAGEPGGPTKV